jgi:hypothetical protein
MLAMSAFFLVRVRVERRRQSLGRRAAPSIPS